MSMWKFTASWLAVWIALSCVLQSSCGITIPKLDVSGEEVVEQLRHLATFSDDPNPAVTRILFTGALGNNFWMPLLQIAGYYMIEPSQLRHCPHISAPAISVRLQTTM